MDYTNIKEKMEKCISVYSEKLSEVRAGRANPAILNKVKIDYYGTPTPINQVAGVSVPEARLIVIQPWDMSILKEIEKAILASDIGINPNNDGKVIRLAFPELTEERRKELVKDIKKMAEEAKVAVRSVRRDGIETAKAEQKEGDMTEDELKQAGIVVSKEEMGKLGVLAWDAGRLNFISRLCLEQEYIVKEECMQCINAAYEMTKEVYTNWKDYAYSYVLGRTLSMGTTNMIGLAEDLLTDTKSPWTYIKW